MKRTHVIDLVEEAIHHSYTYQEYKALLSHLLAEGKSTGHEQSEALTNYSLLNERRMKRLDKTLAIEKSVIDTFAKTQKKVIWLVLSEGWCGDAAQSLPVMNILAEVSDTIQLKIVSRDDHEQLMSNFLTNGGKAIPKLIVYNPQNQKVLNTWGPRPSIATKMVNDYKSKYGSLDAQFKQDLQVWYNKDRGQNIAQDLLQLLQY
ncbi:thioredoxin family protein [Aquimarina sp. U1-2]|uniref:thioredoxin family protein n=1 Tax=Aquimarina sp. U1-2 TaxID=2823141 RepID=UPI001AECDBF0|nr:thioredoxin family protein [Aquimarina sp. U1-2]MBP2831398.1 thioredoxin family protein [Aquimarina sp. U1-2]